MDSEHSLHNVVIVKYIMAVSCDGLRKQAELKLSKEKYKK